MTGTTRLWALGTTIACIVIVALGWFFGVSPLLGRINAADAQRAVVEQQNATAAQRVERLKADFGNLAAVSEQLDRLRESMPPTADYDAFLGELNAIADADSVSLTTFVPAEPGVLALDGSSTAAPAPPGSEPVPVDDGSVVSIPVRLGATGGYSHLLDFLGDLQQAHRLYLVGDSSIEGEGRDYTITVDGYVFVTVDSSVTAPSSPAPTIAPSSTAAP
jgi:Tfp pilus assembly protein PilO